MACQQPQINTNLIPIKGGMSIESALQNIFISNQEENRIQKARKIMGVKIDSLTDEELAIYLTEFQYLIDTWMDEYEKKLLNGKTLRETLNEN
ncbi:MAG: hypothetical protein WCI63_04620 [bacterium]